VVIWPLLALAAWFSMIAFVRVLLIPRRAAASARCGAAVTVLSLPRYVVLAVSCLDLAYMCCLSQAQRWMLSPVILVLPIALDYGGWRVADAREYRARLRVRAALGAQTPADEAK
jgi:hypothetical protein